MEIERSVRPWLVAAMGWAALLAAPATAHSDAKPVSVPDCGVQQIKPADLTIACGDGNDYLKTLAWTVWSASAARGSGIEEVNDCQPYCAAGKFHSYPVTVTLDRVEANHFTRMRLHYPGKRPPNTPQNVSRMLL